MTQTVQVGDIVRVKHLSSDIVRDMESIGLTYDFTELIGKLGCVIAVIHVSPHTPVRVMVAPCDAEFDITNDKDNSLFSDAFYTIQSHLEIIHPSPVRSCIVVDDAPAPFIGHPLPTVMTTIFGGITLSDGRATKSDVWVDQIYHTGECLHVLLDTDNGLLGHFLLSYESLEQTFTTF